MMSSPLLTLNWLLLVCTKLPVALLAWTSLAQVSACFVDEVFVG